MKMAHIVPLSHAKDMGQCFLRFDYFIALGKPIKFQEEWFFRKCTKITNAIFVTLE